jgi:hypothetical protein
LACCLKIEGSGVRHEREFIKFNENCEGRYTFYLVKNFLFLFQGSRSLMESNPR